MIINLDFGHSLSGPGTGAAGLLKEVNVNREVGNKLIAMLRNAGHTVNNCTVDHASSTNEQLAGIVKTSNSHKCDIFISLHLNSGGGRGVESYVLEGASSFTYNMAKRINEGICENTGLANRKVKNANFYVLRNTTAPAILVELFFIDTKSDVDIYNPDKLARGLFKGITGADYVGETGPDEGKELYYRVVCGSFTDKNNAIARAEEIKSKTGHDTYLVAYYK